MRWAADRVGRGVMSPPQFGQSPLRQRSVHAAHQVHSKLHIRADVESGGRSTSQHSHDGFIKSMATVSPTRTRPKRYRAATPLLGR